MRIFAPLLLTAICLLPARAVSAQEVVDIDTAVELALRSNLSIEAEQLGLEVKRRTKDTVYNYFYPKLSAGVTLSRLHEGPGTVRGLAPFGTPDGAGAYDKVIPYSVTPDHTFGLGASLNASLALSYGMIHGIRLALQDYEAGLISLESTRKKLALDVRKTFYTLLVLEENIKLTEQNLAAAQTRYAQAQANYKNGLVDEYTLLSAQVAVESLRPVLEEVKNGYRTSLLSFKMLLGLDFDREIRLSGSIEPTIHRFDAKELSGRFLANRLDIRALVLAGKIGENQIKLQESNLLPVLTFLYSLDPTFSGDPFGDSWFDKEWKQRGGMFGITLSLGVDALLPDSKAKNEIKNAENNREKIRVQLAQALQGAEFEIRRIVMGLEKSAKSMEVLELNVRLAEKANRMGQEAYRAGLKDYSQIETTEVNLNEARLNLLREKYNYLAGLLDLEYALNTTIEKLKGTAK